MSRVAENFLFKFKAARNVKESLSVIDDMKRFLKKKKDALDELLTEISSSRVLIRFVASAAGGATRMTTQVAPVTKVDITFKPADVKKIQKSWDVLVDFSETIAMLEDRLLQQTEQAYKNVPGLKEHLAADKKFLAQCKKSRDEVLAKLNASGSSLIPPDLTVLIKDIKAKLESSLKGRFESCDFMIYPNVVEVKGKHPLAFFCYIHFKGLTDDDQWRKASFYLIVVAVKDEKTGAFQYQVHTDEEGSRLPTEIDLSGTDWLGKIQGVENRILTQLTDQHALNVLTPMPLNKTQDDVKRNRTLKGAHVAVLDIFIEENYLKIITDPKLVTTAEEAAEVCKAVHHTVRTFFNLDGSASISAKPITDGKVWCLYFKLDAPLTKESIAMRTKYLKHDRSDLLELGRKLKLDAHTLHALEDSYKHYLFNKMQKIKPKGFPNSPEDAPGYTIDPSKDADRTKRIAEWTKNRPLGLKVIETPEDDVVPEDVPIPANRTAAPAKKAPVKKAPAVPVPAKAVPSHPPVKLSKIKVGKPTGLKDLKLSKELEDEDIEL
jgi:hypothetical protein